MTLVTDSDGNVFVLERDPKPPHGWVRRPATAEERKEPAKVRCDCPLWSGCKKKKEHW